MLCGTRFLAEWPMRQPSNRGISFCFCFFFLVSWVCAGAGFLLSICWFESVPTNVLFPIPVAVSGGMRDFIVASAAFSAETTDVTSKRISVPRQRRV